MLELLKEQEKRLTQEQKGTAASNEEKNKLSPKIDIEECLRNGYITADDYRKSHK